MKLKKLGHSCLVVEIDGVRVMIDPGKYSLSQTEEKNIDIILITHEHSDHFHLESIKKILEKNPSLEIITNASVGKLLDIEGIKSLIVEDGQEIVSKKLVIKGVGKFHSEIHQLIPVVADVDYVIHNKFFYPGDALHIPPISVEVVAFPTMGGWVKVGEVLAWLQNLKPKIAIPVHDYHLNDDGKKTFYKNYQKVLESIGIGLKILELGKEEEI